MPDAADRLVAAQQRGDIEHMGTVLAADEHNAEGEEQSPGLIAFAAAISLQWASRGAASQVGSSSKLAEEIEEKGFFGL